MKRVVTVFIIMMLFSASALMAQKKMKSPAATAKGQVDGVNIEVKYHQPSAKGRKVMGGLVPYGEIWRTGANNATTISFDQDVKVEGKSLSKGTYSLFTIPGESEWTVIFNGNANQWGAYNYDKSQDVLRITVKPVAISSNVEAFTIEVEPSDVALSWENTKVKFKVSK
ncbi:DUF2911 domain-containing protein [Fulvivirga sediminis]|uniref:DUF2911 domain-containing protein n=1 Tax=Fulvivirga sediminis TaxID=2803949 RepID=A0A937F8E7_9BACT|nr:DUF2911 domain-containing protein [Fulvivirga sediminis]MBL3656179.1 DUF2911 domain-containing protein [Fulvivirga sediminis]